MTYQFSSMDSIAGLKSSHIYLVDDITYVSGEYDYLKNLHNLPINPED